MTDTFTPARPPSYASRKSVTYKTIEANFGDGYVQRTVDGINNKPVMYELTWSALLPAEANAIESFLDSQGGATAFLYTVPRDSTQRKYRCKTWSRSLDTPATDSISATFEEVFDP